MSADHPPPQSPEPGTWFDQGIEDGRDFLTKRFGRPLPLDVSTCFDLEVRRMREARDEVTARGSALIRQGIDESAVRRAVACQVAMCAMESAALLARRRMGSDGASLTGALDGAEVHRG